MVHAGRRTRHCHPVLPGAPAPRETRARADAGGRRRRSGLLSEDPAARGRPRDRQCLPAPPAPGEAAPVRDAGHALSRVLHAQTLQQELRAAPGPLVRPEPSRRGFRRNLCRLARPALDVADALRRMAGPAQAGVHGSPDARRGARTAEREIHAGGGPALAAAEDPRRALPPQARALRPGPPRLLRQRPAQPVLRRARVRQVPVGSALRPARSPGSSQHGRELHRQLPVHDRSAPREDHRALPRPQPPDDRFRRGDQDRLHGVPDRADDELSAQRAPPRRVMSGAKLRILALVHQHLIPPETLPEGADLASAAWRTEYDVVSTLKAMGHEVQTLGVHDDLGDIRRASTDWKPHIAFNLLEGFDDIAIFDQNVVSHLELLKLSYTGRNARGLLIARDKSLSKKLLSYHRIAVPEFEVFRIGRPIRRPKRLEFPLSVKSLTQEASIGISQASVVDSDEKLKERVAFVHESIGTAAIVEQYIEGRELYVGLLGNQTLQAMPVWELFFTNMPEGAKRIATDRVKWSVKYQKKYGIDSGPAKDLADPQYEEIQHLCKRAYRALELSGFARIDLRLEDNGNVWVLEANPNHQIDRGEDYTATAEKIGLSYETVLQRIINLGLRWQPESVA